MIGWDIEAIFRLAGDNRGIVRLCAEGAPECVPPATLTVNVWKSRERIPVPWLPVVVRGLIVRGVPPLELFCDLKVPR
jgi:hypothetical protein